MKKFILAFVFVLIGALNAQAQSTTVSGQVTDSGGQSWNNGTFTATFVPNPQYPTGPYTWTGGTLNTTISGSLSGTGSYSVSIPSNSAISPVGSQWQIQFVPNATSVPFLTPNTTITGATQTLNATPPDISINLQNPPGPFTTAYADDEIAAPIPQGAEYFNTTSLLTRVWNGTSWANQGTGGGGGGTVTGSGVANQVAFWTSASAIGGNTGLTFVPGTKSFTAAGGASGTQVLSAGPSNANVLGVNNNSVSIFGLESTTDLSVQFTRNIDILAQSGHLILTATSGAGSFTAAGLTLGSGAGDLVLQSTAPGNVGVQVQGANKFNFPTATGSSGQVLSTNGANPQVLSWITPGAGTVTTTGSPANGNLTQFSGASSITNGDLSGDVTTSGTLVTTVSGFVVKRNQANTFIGGTGNVQNFTAVSLIVPNGAGLTPTLNASIAFDTTNFRYNGGLSGANVIFPWFSSGTPVSGQCATWSGTLGLLSSASCFANPMTTLGDIIFENSTPAAARLAGPTTPNGVPQSLTSTPSGGLAVAPAWALSGVPVDATNPATLLVTDRSNYLNWTSGSALALPAVATSFASNFPFVLKNTSGGTLTITPNAGASDLIDGSATGTIINNFAAFVYQDGTTAPGHWFTIKYPTFAAFPACADSVGNHLNFTTAAGFSCGTSSSNAGTVTSVGLQINAGSSSGIFAVTGSPVTTSGNLNYNLTGTSGGIPYFSSTSVLSSSALLTNKQVVLGGGAGSAPVSIDFPDFKVVPAANCNNTTAGAGWSIGSGGTVTCRAGTNNLGGFVAITDTASTFAQFTVAIPEDWDSGSNPFIRFQIASTDTTNGHTIIPQIKVSCAKGDGTTTDDVTFNAAHSLSTTTLNTTANQFWSTSNVQMNSTDVTGCVAGALMIVQVGRATDTATNAEFYSATMTFPRLLTVQAN
jgi:hypothetical protein